jgi:Skp family chaperone for outer membrane proteins
MFKPSRSSFSLALTGRFPFEKLGAMKKSLFLALLALSFGLPARADLKIAIVDTAQAFDAYYKTNDMASRIAAHKANFEREIQAVQAEYSAAMQEAQDLETKVKDTSAPLDLRKSNDTALAQKMQDIQAMDREIQEMQRSRSEEIKSELEAGHREIADEIVRAVAACVGSQGYDLVIDKAAEGSNLSSIIAYQAEKTVDLTSEVIARLNASAPPAQASAAH